MDNQIIEVRPIQVDQVVKDTGTVAGDMLNMVTTMSVSTAFEYADAARLLKEVKDRGNTLEAERKKLTGPIDAAKAAVQELFRKPKEILETAEKMLKGKMLVYVEDQEAKRRVEQEKLERIAAEDRRKKEEQEAAWRKKAEDLAAAGKLKEAEKAAAKADERAVAAQEIIAPVVAPKVDKMSGLSYRDDWYAEVTDFAALDDQYKVADMVTLNKLAKAMKDKGKVPGVAFKCRKIVASK